MSTGEIDTSPVAQPPQAATASADTPLLDDSPSNQELPMVVWLKGDEPYVEEFSLSAGEAMDILGIKRSRLTQISGNELRVGRLKKGRYISPVFRKIDVLTYKQWTRPTASHKKSSEILDSAVEELKNAIETANSQAGSQWEEQQQALLQSIQELTGDLSDKLENPLREHRAALRMIQKALANHRHEQNLKSEKLLRRLSQHIAASSRQRQEIQNQQASLVNQSVKQIQAMMNLGMQNLQEKLNSTMKEMESQQSALAREISDLSAAAARNAAANREFPYSSGFMLDSKIRLPQPLPPAKRKAKPFAFGASRFPC